MNQRIYIGGTQFHIHYPEVPHESSREHDGYWLHYHDGKGMVAVTEEPAGTVLFAGAVADYFTEWIDSHDESWWDDAGDACDLEGRLAEAFLAGYGKCLENHP